MAAGPLDPDRTVAARLRRFLPASVAFLLTTTVVVVLFSPGSLSPGTRMPDTAFADSHVWAFDHVARMLTGDRPFVPRTDAAGFPTLRGAPVLGWAPALLAGLLRRLAGLSPITAFNLVFYASPGLAAVAGTLWLRRVSGASAWVCATLAMAWALCAPLLATMAAGNIDQAQVWVYPAWLTLGWVAVESGGIGSMLGASFVGALAAFTEPYLGLFLPLFGAPVLAWRAATLPAPRRGMIRVAGLLVVTALAMSPAGWWFGGSHDRSSPQVFAPAPAPDVGSSLIRSHQSPSAEPMALLLPERGVPDWSAPVHVVYLGLPLLALGLGVGWRRSSAQVPGLLIAGVGAVVTLGPQLILDGHWQRQGAMPYLLPMALLEHLGYPLARGGQYYRAAPIAGLGLATLAAAGLAALRGRRVAILLAALVAFVAVADNVRATATAWPRPSHEVLGRAVCAVIAASPRPGAVLTLPLVGDQADGGRKLLLAALHGRPSSALPVHLPAMAVPDETRWYGLWRGAVGTRESWRRPGLKADATRTLREAGFAAVLLTPHGGPDLPEFSPEILQLVLGAPAMVDGDFQLWWVP